MSKKNKCSCGSGLNPDRCCHGDSVHEFICSDCGETFSSIEKHVIQIGDSSLRAKNKRFNLCRGCSEKRIPTTFLPSMLYKYIHFVETEKKPKTKVYSCRNNKSEIELGVVKWYPSWRQYCLFTVEDVIFNQKCLEDIQDFIGQLNVSHKKTI